MVLAVHTNLLYLFKLWKISWIQVNPSRVNHHHNLRGLLYRVVLLVWCCQTLELDRVPKFGLQQILNNAQNNFKGANNEANKAIPLLSSEINPKGCIYFSN